MKRKKAGFLEVNDGREHPFFVIDNALINELGAEIGVYGIAVYCVLAMFAGANAEAWPSYQTIADLIGISRPKAVSTIQMLVEKGLIRKEARVSDNGDKTSNRYTLVKQSKWSGGQQDLPGGKQHLLGGSKPDLPPGKPDELGSQSDLPPSQHHLPPVVNAVDHPSKQRLPEQDLLNKNQLEQDTGTRDVGAAPTPHPDAWDDFLGALCWICYRHQDLKALTEDQFGALSAEAKRLYDDGYTRANLHAWMEQYWYKDWRWEKGKQRPRPDMVRSMIPVLRSETYATPGSPPDANDNGIPAAPVATPPPPSQPPQPASPWGVCLKELQTTMTPETFAWLTGSELEAAGEVHGNNGEQVALYHIVLARADGMTWLTNRMGSQIRRRLSSILGQPVQIEIVATAQQEEVVNA